MSRPLRRVLTALTLLALVVSDRPAAAGAAPAPVAGTLAARRRAAELAGPRIVLATPEGAERQVAVRDLAFVFFKRTFFTRRAPRSEDASGSRIDIEDRRADCRCVRFADWSKVKFRLLRQIEITYPEAGRQALVRMTRTNGRVQEVPAGNLAGARSPLPPRFVATVDGAVREYPLLLGDDPGERWPDEKLVRVLLAPPPPRRR